MGSDLNPTPVSSHWQASQVGSSIAQNFGASISATGCFDCALDRIDDDACAADAPMPPDADTALSSPPRPVDFSAEVAASEVYAGVHTPTAAADGLAVGQAVGTFVATTQLQQPG